MSWTVHGLHAEALMLTLEQIDVVLIVLVMTRGLPQLEVKHVWSDYLIISSDSIFSFDQVDELVIDLSTMWVPESASR